MGDMIEWRTLPGLASWSDGWTAIVNPDDEWPVFTAFAPNGTVCQYRLPIEQMYAGRTVEVFDLQLSTGFWARTVPTDLLGTVHIGRKSEL